MNEIEGLRIEATQHFAEKGLKDEFLENEVDTFLTQELDSAKHFTNQCIDAGYTLEQSDKWATTKLSLAVKNIEAEVIPFGHFLSFEELCRIRKDWVLLKGEERDKFFNELGFQTNKYKLYIKFGCLRKGTKILCGPYMYGCERTDKEWLSLMVDGKHVASMDVRMRDDYETLELMRRSSFLNPEGSFDLTTINYIPPPTEE